MEARMEVAKVALQKLHERRQNHVSLPASSLTAGASHRNPQAVTKLPKFLSPPNIDHGKEEDVSVLARYILLNTRMVLTGSDERRLFIDFTKTTTSPSSGIKRSHPGSSASSSTIAATGAGSSSSTSARKRAALTSANIARGCRVPGCGKPFALTSSYYCIAHVGSGALCTIPNCVRAAEGDGPKPLCRLHMIEEQETITKSNKTASQRVIVAGQSAGTVVDANPKQRRCNFDTCIKTARGSSWFCIQHGGGKRCQFRNCARSARGATSFCVTHGGGRRCSVELCPKSAVGKTNLCIAHGGGKRCEYSDCGHSAEGATSFCIRHGGGRRCRTPECNKSAVGTTDHCVACGGGRRCNEEGCEKSAVGSTQFCKAHGGGRRCTHPDGCNKSAQGATFLCIFHGGGKRCGFTGCTKSTQGMGAFCKAHESAAGLV